MWPTFSLIVPRVTHGALDLIFVLSSTVFLRRMQHAAGSVGRGDVDPTAMTLESNWSIPVTVIAVSERSALSIKRLMRRMDFRSSSNSTSVARQHLHPMSEHSDPSADEDDGSLPGPDRLRRECPCCVVKMGTSSPAVWCTCRWQSLRRVLRVAGSLFRFTGAFHRILTVHAFTPGFEKGSSGSTNSPQITAALGDRRAAVTAGRNFRRGRTARKPSAPQPQKRATKSIGPRSHPVRRVAQLLLLVSVLPISCCFSRTTIFIGQVVLHGCRQNGHEHGESVTAHHNDARAVRTCELRR